MTNFVEYGDKIYIQYNNFEYIGTYLGTATAEGEPGAFYVINVDKMKSTGSTDFADRSVPGLKVFRIGATCTADTLKFKLLENYEKDNSHKSAQH